MKKLFTLLTMLVLGIGSMWGQVVTTWTDAFAESLVSRDQLVASAGTGKWYAFRMPSTSKPGWCDFVNVSSASLNNVSADYLFSIENGSTQGKYKLKRKDGKYLSGNATFNESGMDLTLTNRVPSNVTDYAQGLSNSSPFVSIDNPSGNHYNCGNGDGGLQFRGGAGGWSVYAVVGPIYRVIFKCKVNGELIYTESVFAKTGDVLNVPDLPGYTASPSSYTVGSDDASPEITYTPSSYPVNFTRGQTFTRSDRYINSVTFEIEGEEQTVNELYNNTSTKCYQDLTDSKMVTLPVNTSVKPKFGVAGAWQHGFVYIDLNGDGDFTDDGELVSKINEGNPTLSTDMPEFETPSTPGTYRMRIKTDWSSVDPGGNTGDDDSHTITSNNHIIKNGGMIVDVTLEIVDLYSALIAKLEKYPYGTGLNKYHVYDESSAHTYYGEVISIINGLKEAGYSESNLATAQALIDGTQMNMPPAGFYRIKGHGGTNSSEKYMASGFVSVGSTNMFPMTTETDATTIFYYDGTKLTNFSSGMCNGVTSSDWAWVTEDNASTVTFQDGLTFGGYVIQTKNAYFYDNGNASTSHVDRGSVADISGIGKRYRNWYLEEVTSLPVTFNSSALGYATFCCPVALRVPAKVEAYLCKKDGSTLRLFKADQITEGGDYVLPAGTAVLLYNKDFGTDDTKYFTVTSATDKYDNNGFIGTVAAQTPDYSSNWYYALRKKSGSMGFYLRSDQSATLTGFRAWLEVPKSEDARDFTIVFGGESDPTGIVEAFGLQNDNVEIYDLNGRRLSSYKNGINIVNGKKVFK